MNRREASRWRQLERADHQVADDGHHSCGDHLIEGILQEAAQPSPEQPLHLRDDEERHENRPYEHAYGGGNESISNDDQRNGLRSCEQDGHDNIYGRSENVAPGGRVHARLEIGYSLNDVLELSLVDAA